MSDNRRVTVLAVQAASAPAIGVIGPTVIAVVAFIFIWRHALHSKGKGTIPGRLLGVVITIFVVWVLLAVKAPDDATKIASGTATGVGGVLTAIGNLIHAI